MVKSSVYYSSGGCGPELPLFAHRVTSASGLEGDGGWKITDQGRTIRFEVEKSLNCEGTNDNIQTGEAVTNVTVTPPAKLAYTLQGQGELELKGFENLDFYLDGDLVANATSPGGDLGCPGGDGPVLVDTIQASPIAISGKHELRLEFTTADEFYHNESFYELTFYYICE